MLAEQKELENDAPAAADFSGVWKLVKNENCDTFHKSQGIKWAKRKILNNIKMQVTIRQKKNVVQVKISTSVTSMVDEYVIGAKEKCTVVPMTKETLRGKLYWQDAKRDVLIIETQNITKKRPKIITKRSMPTKDTMIDISVNTNNVIMRRTYKRVK